jgi:hypothetical protein
LQNKGNHEGLPLPAALDEFKKSLVSSYNRRQINVRKKSGGRRISENWQMSIFILYFTEHSLFSSFRHFCRIINKIISIRKTSITVLVIPFKNKLLVREYLIY